MGRIYKVTWNGDIAAADAVVDLLEIQPAAQRPCRLVGYILSQTSEVGDAQEEGLRIDVIRMPATFTSGSGGATIQGPHPDDDRDAAAGFTAEGRNTTEATTSGTAETLSQRAWNVRNSPYEAFWPEPNLRPRAENGEGLVVRLQTTVADTITCAFEAWVEEL